MTELSDETSTKMYPAKFEGFSEVWSMLQIGELISLKKWVALVIGALVVIFTVIIVMVYKDTHRWDGPEPDKRKFDISFVTEPTKPVPSWLDHGNGMSVSITIKAWAPDYYKKFKDDGIFIVPTSIQPTQSLSVYFMPPSPQGLQANNGGGPLSLENAINEYFQQRRFAPIQHGYMNQIASIHGTFKNVSFPAAVGNGGVPILQTNDLRLVILDVRERNNQFKVMWSKVYSATNLSK